MSHPAPPTHQTTIAQWETLAKLSPKGRTIPMLKLLSALGVPTKE